MAHPSYLFVFLDVFDQEGGIQTYNRNLLTAYSQLPDQPEATVMLLRDGARSTQPIASDRLYFRYFKTQSVAVGRLKLAVAMLTHLLRYRPQRVFCGHINLAPLVALLCRPLQIPYTVITHGKEVWPTLPGKLRQPLQQADQIWAVSRYSRDRAAAANGLDLDKLQLLPNTVDGDRFTPAAASPPLIQQYGLSDATVILTVARLWSGDIYKGVDVTIRALPTIAQTIPNVKYLVIGRGDDQPRLAALAQELGVADRVVFAGYVPTEALVEHYRLANAYVMPSQEGFGIVYLEAMACGIPVVSGDADGSADPLQDGQLGWRVPHRDPDAVATACIALLQGGDRRCDGAWLREQVLQQFGFAAFTQRLSHLLNHPRSS